LNIARIIQHDIANGPGVRTTLFVSGCNFHCPGCFNAQAQDFSYGEKWELDTFEKIMDMVSDPVVNGLSLLGGDPLHQDILGMCHLVNLCRATRLRGKTVWLWSGFRWEDVFMNRDTDTAEEMYRQMVVSNCDVFVDGPFVEEEKDLSLAWRGSRNQRVIDVQKSLAKGKVVLWEHD